MPADAMPRSIGSDEADEPEPDMPLDTPAPDVPLDMLPEPDVPLDTPPEVAPPGAVLDAVPLGDVAVLELAPPGEVAVEELLEPDMPDVPSEVEPLPVLGEAPAPLDEPWAPALEPESFGLAVDEVPPPGDVEDETPGEALGLLLELTAAIASRLHRS